MEHSKADLNVNYIFLISSLSFSLAMDGYSKVRQLKTLTSRFDVLGTFKNYVRSD